MYQSIIIGHLGADAERGTTNGKSWVRFRVATSRKYNANGEQQEETNWHSCIMSGDGGELFQYLKKGQAVCVIGNTSVRVVSSPKLRRMIASTDINVQTVELLGSAVRESVPHEIATPDGALVTVNKAYFIDIKVSQEYCNKAGGNCLFYDAKGGSYVVQPEGWVTPFQAAQQEQEPQQTQATAEPQVEATEEPAEKPKRGEK